MCFEALGVLISGLGLVGLVITVASQLEDARERDFASQESLATQRAIGTVLALSAVRDFAGRRIDHLRKAIDQGTIEKTDQITREDALEEIGQLRERIRDTEKQLALASIELQKAMPTSSPRREARNSVA